MSKPINSVESERLLALLEKNQLKPVLSIDALKGGFEPTIKTQDSTDLINLIRERLGPDHKVNVVPLELMVMSTQDEFRT